MLSASCPLWGSPWTRRRGRHVLSQHVEGNGLPLRLGQVGSGSCLDTSEQTRGHGGSWGTWRGLGQSSEGPDGARETEARGHQDGDVAAPVKTDYECARAWEGGLCPRAVLRGSPVLVCELHRRDPRVLPMANVFDRSVPPRLGSRDELPAAPCVKHLRPRREARGARCRGGNPARLSWSVHWTFRTGIEKHVFPSVA